MTGLPQEEARAILEAVQADWNRSMATWDAAQVSQVYDREAQLFGSLSELFRGRDGAKAYFAAFPTAESCVARFDNQEVVSPARDVIVASGFVTFAMRVAGEAREAAFRFTFVLRQSERWAILAHHASPMPQSSPAG